jgi:hypothetical protein
VKVHARAALFTRERVSQMDQIANAVLAALGIILPSIIWEQAD